MIEEKTIYITSDGKIFEDDDAAYIHDIDILTRKAKLTFYDDSCHVMDIPNMEDSKYISWYGDDETDLYNALEVIDTYVGMDIRYERNKIHKNRVIMFDKDKESWIGIDKAKINLDKATECYNEMKRLLHSGLKGALAKDNNVTCK